MHLADSLVSSADQIDLFDSRSGMSPRLLIVERQQGNHGNERLRVALH